MTANPIENMDVRSLRPSDVLCGRGSGPNDHPGNIAFRQIILSRKVDYMTAKARTDKARIAQEIVDRVERGGGLGGEGASEPGRFLRKMQAEELKERGYDREDDVWVVVDRATALEKAKQALRQNRDNPLVEEELRRSLEERGERERQEKESQTQGSKAMSTVTSGPSGAATAPTNPYRQRNVPVVSYQDQSTATYTAGGGKPAGVLRGISEDRTLGCLEGLDPTDSALQQSVQGQAHVEVEQFPYAFGAASSKNLGMSGMGMSGMGMSGISDLGTSGMTAISGMSGLSGLGISEVQDILGQAGPDVADPREGVAHQNLGASGMTALTGMSGVSITTDLDDIDPIPLGGADSQQIATAGVAIGRVLGQPEAGDGRAARRSFFLQQQEQQNRRYSGHADPDPIPGGGANVDYTQEYYFKPGQQSQRNSLVGAEEQVPQRGSLVRAGTSTGGGDVSLSLSELGEPSLPPRSPSKMPGMQGIAEAPSSHGRISTSNSSSSNSGKGSVRSTAVNMLEGGSSISEARLTPDQGANPSSGSESLMSKMSVMSIVTDDL